MSKKLRVIVKRPDAQYGYVVHMSNTLQAFQKAVGGHIETVKLTDSIIMVVNEDGKNLGLPRNFVIRGRFWADVIVGTVVLVGQDGEEFADCPLEFDVWKKMLKRWGN